jgi:hypothetical protein
MIDGILDQLGRILHADFIHDVAAVHFHRAHADLKPPSHWLIEQVVGDEVRDSSFARGQSFERIISRKKSAASMPSPHHFQQARHGLRV